MLNRFAGFPIHVETISRFKTAAEQKDILNAACAKARWTSSSEPTGCSPRMWNSRTSACSSSMRNSALAFVHKEAIKKLKRSRSTC